MNGNGSKKSFGELPTWGREEPPGKEVRAEGPSWSERDLSEAETLRPPAGIRDDGRTDAARRWGAGEEILDRYVVERELGQGGMGVVYGCLDKVGGVRVAVKCLPPELSHNSVEMEEVRENFQLVYGLSHPNIAGVRQLERDGRGEYFLVMEEAAGESLRRWLRAKWKAGGVRLEAAVGILRQVAAALDYAHGEKVIHRDVKPGNVMIDVRGRVKVLDFGLASQIRTSLSRASHAFRGTSGTGPYMAPEQWRGRRQDGKTDQYALGVMAYEMLAGHLPFENDEVSVLREVVLKEEPEDIPGVPERAMAAIRRAMSKNAADRFPACGAFVDALESADSQGRASTPCEPEKRPAAGRAAGRPARPEASPHHHRSIGGWVAGAVLAAAVGVGVWWGGWGREAARPEGSLQQTRLEAASPDAGETTAPPVEAEAPGALSEDPLAVPPEGASRSEMEDALARLEARRDALLQEGYAVADPERAPVEAALAALEERIDAALDAEAEKAREAEREGRRAAAQRAADLEALGDLKKAVDRRMASLDPTWQDGLFGKKRKAMADARKKLEACTDASSLAKAKELRGDIYDAADWIERNTPARSGLSDEEKALEALADACTSADAGKLAGGTFHKAVRARKEGEKHRDAGRFEDAVAEYAAAKGFYEAALKEARRAKAVACVDEAHTFAESKMWTECMKAADSALVWEADNAEAKQLKEEAERSARVEQGLEAALGAERREAWEEAIAAVEGVLALDPGNAEAQRMKETAEGKLKPILVVSATLVDQASSGWTSQSGEPSAVLQVAGKTYTLPTPIDCSGLSSFGPGDVTLEKDGKTYAGAFASMIIDWKGEKTVSVELSAVAEAAHPEDLSNQQGCRAGERRTVRVGAREVALRWCPAGTFTMGSPFGESGRDVDETQHRVTLTRGFWMGETEVPQWLWREVMGKNPSFFKNGDNYPVEQVSWEDCQMFVQLLNSHFTQEGFQWALPTEAQWEYACRAGTDTAYFWENALNGDKANCNGNYPCGTTVKGPYKEKTTPVGSYDSNAWGLYDMHGNVCEWCSDSYGLYSSGSVTDPRGPKEGVLHVIRGGAWCNGARSCRSGDRGGSTPDYRFQALGVRLALLPVQ